VGARGEDSAARGVNGDETDDSAGSAGAAYVFVRSGDVWTQQAYLKGSNTEARDRFGAGVAVSGDTLVVGAPFESQSQGAAYVFVRDGSVWSEQAFLEVAGADSFDLFGESVGISGDTVVVGAPGEDSAATGVGGDDTDDSLESAGAAFVFVRTGTAWTQQAYLKASNTDPGDLFGRSVAISGDTVAVGAPGESSDARGIGGDQSKDSAFEAGAAYVFVRSGSVWAQQAYLKASNTDAFDAFGTSVAASGDVVVVGAPFEDGDGTGIDANGSDDSEVSAGAAYVFAREGVTWGQAAYAKAFETDANDAFGTSVTVSGDTVVAGAPDEDGSATGVGAPADDAVFEAGAAYSFR
jgi:hypothetical protein